ncbi:heparan sulfate glucosamine 3-O-sulfotransferase 5 [Biomphalaria glabrata]|uniref:Heparan sulfate glucosamine 3-O-sulfotransferase 5-like n=1 Tax=Biomphalaria glabrata TaxID=6526 RepID=A0A9W3ABH7_BIOGL|nr:heparan sulfate glucosamine 3-O-sulfotransferase 5-like [Biomphalaria glabrata]XP_013072054.2 heparan sulfate glucosamine 3-O-sulfotransferase 5-like [Biomphalaria glabrata]XP_013072061.2 heparan sulfate glucosamine 3-O-sulfotransferase 5-like [Biomphalaria glabrata]XP_013072064.2 heparan sulfate glucosamine 3-O-sulfotransferase 5-like [Biomphalaria glabrata]XP_055884654.1 heparan sulfate glucosamine 3-O-sulfotransferase 5-like [Biomphalaria glabrata]XP_055884655.1 heparan sulfate glucosami
MGGGEKCSTIFNNPPNMRRSFRRWFRSCSIAFPAVLFLYVTVFHNGFLFAAITYGTGPLDDVIANSNKGFRKLLEEGLLERDRYNGTVPVHRLPQSIIIGARKCGTRALIEFLELHPQINSPTDEMHFFSNDTNYKMGLDWYRKKMPLSYPDQITIEKTPRYFISKISPSRVHRMNSSVKLIAILRHPTTRVISDYTQICANKMAKNETAEAFEYLALNRQTGHINPEYRAIKISMYHLHIARWLELFPLKQLHIVDGDNLIVNPLEEIRKVETFLNLPHRISKDSLYFNNTRGFYCMRKTKNGPEKCLGANKGRKHANISEKIIHKLDKFFKPHNERLFKLIKRRFRWR